VVQNNTNNVNVCIISGVDCDAAHCVYLPHTAVAIKPTKVYLKAMEAALEAEADLLVCRARTVSELMSEVECFEKATQKFAYNASWAKQVGALYVMSAQRQKAYRNFNHSYMTILDAQGMLNQMKTAPISNVAWLKLYHIREKDGALELAKVWFQALQMEHRNVDAKNIIDEFIEPLEDYSESTDLFRSMGSVTDVIKVKREWRQWKESVRRSQGKKVSKKEKESTISVTAEEVPRMAEELANRWLSAHFTIHPDGIQQSLNFSRAACGVGFQYKSMYTAAEMVHYLSLCVAKWGQLRDHLKEEGEPIPYGSLLRTPLHALSAFSTEYLIRVLIDTYPSVLTIMDNFGATPLHIATANGNKRGMAAIIRAGGADMLHVKDAGGFTPIKLGCSNPSFRSTMDTFLKQDLSLTEGCGPHTLLEKFADDAAEEEDDGANDGGGWDDATPDEDGVDCQFDVRAGSSISHHELIGRYLHSSRPIVLRNVIPEKFRKLLRKQSLRDVHGALSVRHEEFPAAELYGGKLFEVSTLASWIRNGTKKSFGSIEINKRHKLAEQLRWMPKRLVPATEGYTSVDDSWPMLVLGGKGATTNNVFRSSHYFFALVHGKQEWRVQPPFESYVTRDPIDWTKKDVKSLRCSIHAGDVVVLPALWGSAYRSKGESVGVGRRFLWK
jgi:hypothetical protein